MKEDVLTPQVRQKKGDLNSQSHNTEACTVEITITANVLENAVLWKTPGFTLIKFMHICLLPLPAGSRVTADRVVASAKSDSDSTLLSSQEFKSLEK